MLFYKETMGFLYEWITMNYYFLPVVFYKREILSRLGCFSKENPRNQVDLIEMVYI